MTDVEALRSMARDGYTFGYAMVENYRTLYEQAVDAGDPRFTGGFGRYWHYSEPFTSANTDIGTSNNDTPYSWGWFDLRSEPWVIEVPAIDRFYILPFHDLYTVYAGYVSAATTGTGPGRYLLAGPSWTGGTPDGFDGIISASTDFVGCLGRTAFTDGDVDELRRIQHSYTAIPLSAHLGTPAPATESLAWPTWDEAAATDIRFYDYLDHLLQFAPTLPKTKSSGTGSRPSASTGAERSIRAILMPRTGPHSSKDLPTASLTSTTLLTALPAHLHRRPTPPSAILLVRDPVHPPRTAPQRQRDQPIFHRRPHTRHPLHTRRLPHPLRPAHTTGCTRPGNQLAPLAERPLHRHHPRVRRRHHDR